MFGSLGFMEMALIAIVAVVLFGGRLPEVARTFGQYYAQFKKQLADIQSTISTQIDLDQKPRLHDYSDVDYSAGGSSSNAADFDAPPEDDDEEESVKSGS